MEDTLTTPIVEPVVGTPVGTNAAPTDVAAPVDAVVAPVDTRGDRNRTGERGRGPRRTGGGGGGKDRRGPRSRGERTKPEFDQKIVSLRRVTRVTSGGRRFSFSVCVVAGNKKGQVGVGLGKASDTPLAIEKAFRDAKKNMITINFTPSMSIPHEVNAKFASSVVKIMPAPGKGILAGSSVRTVLELAGLKEVSSKLLSRSKNQMNNAFAAIKALESLKHTKIKQPKQK